MSDDSPITLNSSFITAWYPGGRLKSAVNVPSLLARLTCHFEGFTCICQIEGALIFASFVPQDNLVNACIGLGNLDFVLKANLVHSRQR